MNAVVVSVTINDFDQARGFLREQVVPRVQQAPGFVTGYWVAIDGQQRGRSVIVFESEEAAQNAAKMIEQAEEEGVTIDSVDVGEVVAHV
jgi:hypothetical protein